MTIQNEEVRKAAAERAAQEVARDAFERRLDNLIAERITWRAAERAEQAARRADYAKCVRKEAAKLTAENQWDTLVYILGCDAETLKMEAADDTAWKARKMAEWDASEKSKRKDGAKMETQEKENMMRLEKRVNPRNPKARQRFLCGTDDGKPFEVRVPMRITTVDEALDWLRPSGVPRSALRQGEFFFVQVDDFHTANCCDAAIDDGEYVEEGWTDAGSSYRWRYTEVEEGFTTNRNRHVPDDCVMLEKSGDVMFYGRKGMKSHSFQALPRYFVAGGVEDKEHGRLEFPDGNDWYEVVPNKAHGPFRGRGGLD